MTTITRLTPSNVQALRDVFPDAVASGELILTATTATFAHGGARQEIESKMAELPTRGHPRASLHAVVRKLRALES